jgi:hypothetical protein
MAVCSIALGTEDRLAALYSYPNVPGSVEPLADTILYWFNQTLERDGLAALGATAAVRTSASGYVLDLDGPAAVADRLSGYATRLPRFLENGWNALTTVIPTLQADGKWDPSPDPGQGYRPWRFFLPHGLAMLEQRSLQFFHYPPIRLLESMRDYLNDPVPVRWAELLEANGVPSDQEAWLYERVVDATPIAAEDDQGSKQGGDPTWGLIPIQYFHDYQRAQVELFLNPAAGNDRYTIPVVVYGNHPRATFQALYGVTLGVNVAGTAEIVPGRKTAVLGANHPYMFYAAAQGFDTVGSGRFLSPKDCERATAVLQKDLVVARWQVVMSEDPSLDPVAVLGDCTTYWHDPARVAQICALVQHQGSLSYPDAGSLSFRFDRTLEQAAALCASSGNQPCAAVVPSAGAGPR